MTSEEIIRFLTTQQVGNEMAVKIDFRTRASIRGLIVQSDDFRDLGSKNFWRVVTRANMNKWKATGQVELAKIFNGAEFTRLSVISIWDED
jgi:hypothetical protein